MAMRVTGVGAQYLLNMLDADKNYYDGSKTYRVTLPKGIPKPTSGRSQSTTSDAFDARHAAAPPARW